jgi:DNA ligase 1
MFKPMLACNVTDLSKINFPVYCSPKIDGIRCIILKGEVLSRSLKPIPNKFIQSQLRGFDQDLDGELYIPGKTFNEISSAVMSEEGEPDFVYLVFDEISDKPYCERLQFDQRPPNSADLECVHVSCLEGLLSLEKRYIEEGHEGLMIRSPEGPYKYGRSTEKEGYLMKLKRFEDYEAIITGFIEENENTNEQSINELGKKKRSSHKANKLPKDTLGALLLTDTKTGVEFKVSSGLDHALKKEIWLNKELYKGRLIKYKCMASLKDKPRHPTFLGFRDQRDL